VDIAPSKYSIASLRQLHRNTIISLVDDIGRSNRAGAFKLITENNTGQAISINIAEISDEDTQVQFSRFAETRTLPAAMRAY
jgi:hypothetical protein